MEKIPNPLFEKREENKNGNDKDMKSTKKIRSCN